MTFSFSYPNNTFFLPTNANINIEQLTGPSYPKPDDVHYTISPSSNNILDSTIALNFNSTNGTISGTTYLIDIHPNLIDYTVTAYYNNDASFSSTTLSIAINYSPIFSYTQESFIFPQFANITLYAIPLFENIVGVVYSLVSSTPAYPSLADLSLNLSSTTGNITGASNIVTAVPSHFVIRANNNGVIYDTSFNISFQTLPYVSYTQPSYTLTQNIPISISPIPVTQLDTLVRYSISGCYLPFGLEFDTTTGTISGNPSTLTTFRTYTITITNTIGTTNTTLKLNVIKEFLAPPVQGDNFSDNVFITNPDIEMRRKAEIFKYKKNSSNLTKRQYYSLLAKGNGPYAKRAWGTQGDAYTDPNNSGLALLGNTIICASNPIICAPTSSSDVPGPVMNLCYNPTVPLIGYLAPNRKKVDIGFKWPQRTWQRGFNGFPIGKAGSG